MSAPRAWWRQILFRPRVAPVMTPLILACTAALVALCRLYWESVPASLAIHKVRLAARFLGPAFLAWGFLPFFLLHKLRLSFLSSREQLALRAAFRALSILFLLLLVCDLLTLGAMGDRLPGTGAWREATLDLGLAALVVMLMIHAHWLNAIDFEAFRALAAEPPVELLPASTSFKLVDSLDLKVLAWVERSGGDLAHLWLAAESVAEPELSARLKKLVLLRCLDFQRARYGYRFALTPQGQDLLNLPASLFGTTIHDPETIRQLALIRYLLGRERCADVLVEAARLLERQLRKWALEADPALVSIGGKPLDRATLGELIGHAHRTGITDRFQDLLLNAVNHARSRNVHAGDGDGASVTVDDAYHVATLTEIALQSLHCRLPAGCDSRIEPQ